MYWVACRARGRGGTPARTLPTPTGWLCCWSGYAGVVTAERTARFRCVIAVADADGSLLGSVEGTVEGLIATEPRGTHGFGYDPVFWLPERGCTMAELSPEEKNAISHRARAAAAARDLLAAWRG